MAQIGYKRSEDMGQSIVKPGKLNVTNLQDVVFTRRELIDITVNENDNVVIRFVKKCNEGTELETIRVPFDIFTNVAEEAIWEAIDNALE